MLVNHEYKFVFAAAPRTASTSIRSWLGQLPGSILDPAQHAMTIPDECKGYLIFATIRKPDERLLSLWRYHSRNDEDARPLDQYLRDFQSMAVFHSFSQLRWYQYCSPFPRLLTVDSSLQSQILRTVFDERGISRPMLPNLPTLNASGPPVHIPQSVRVASMDACPEDWRAWSQCQQHSQAADQRQNASEPQRRE